MEAAGLRSGGPLREHFIVSVTQIFETTLRDACQLLDQQTNVER